MPEENTEINRALGRVEGKLDSLISTVTHLSNSFQQLEAGRVSTLESGFATLKAEASAYARNTAIWVSAGISLIVGVVLAIVIKKLGL